MLRWISAILNSDRCCLSISCSSFQDVTPRRRNQVEFNTPHNLGLVVIQILINQTGRMTDSLVPHPQRFNFLTQRTPQHSTPGRGAYRLIFTRATRANATASAGLPVIILLFHLSSLSCLSIVLDHLFPTSVEFRPR